MTVGSINVSVGFYYEALLCIGALRSSVSPPALRKATTPAAGGTPGGNLGMGVSPLLIAMTQSDSIPAAASVAETRSLRRNRLDSVMAISGARRKHTRPSTPPHPTQDPASSTMPNIFQCRNRNPRQASRSIGFRAGVHFQYDSYERDGVGAARFCGTPIHRFAEVHVFLAPAEFKACTLVERQLATAF
jgi:hypothetical protein